MNALNAQVRSLAPTALLDLFRVDIPAVGSNAAVTYRFHNGTNGIGETIKFGYETVNGQQVDIEYALLPIDTNGFDINGEGTLPTPTIKVGNALGGMTRANLAYDDLVGAMVTRTRVFAKFLNPSNFPQGNPDANAAMVMPPEIYFIDQKSSENAFYVEYRLSSSMNMAGIKLPGRQIISNMCLFEYKSADCNAQTCLLNGALDPAYAWVQSNTYERLDDISEDDPLTKSFCHYQGVIYRALKHVPPATASPKDATEYWRREWCNHTLNDCVKLFGKTNTIRFGGFPGAARNPVR